MRKLQCVMAAIVALLVTAAAPSWLRAGDIGRMCIVSDEDCICAPSMDDIILGIRYSAEGDATGVLHLIETGKAGLLKKGTIVFIQGRAIVEGVPFVRVQVAGIQGWTWITAMSLRCE